MKKKLLLVSISLLLVMISAAALMTGISLTLDSSQPVKAQAEALVQYIDQLPAEQQDSWFEEINTLTTNRNTIFALSAPDADDGMVYVTNSGKRYHSSENCSGLHSAKRISAVTKEAAHQKGRTACKICYPNGDSW